MESPMSDSVPIYNLFSDMRQSFYAVLFNLNHLKFLRKQFNDAIKERRKRAEGIRSQAKVRCNHTNFFFKIFFTLSLSYVFY